MKKDRNLQMTQEGMVEPSHIQRGWPCYGWGLSTWVEDGETRNG